MQPDTTSASERCQGSFPGCASQSGVREKLQERRRIFWIIALVPDLSCRFKRLMQLFSNRLSSQYF